MWFRCHGLWQTIKLRSWCWRLPGDTHLFLYMLYFSWISLLWLVVANSFESQFHFHSRRCEGSAGKQVNLNGKVKSNRHTGEQLVVCLLCMMLFQCIFKEQNDGSVVRREMLIIKRRTFKAHKRGITHNCFCCMCTFITHGPGFIKLNVFEGCSCPRWNRTQLQAVSFSIWVVKTWANILPLPQTHRPTLLACLSAEIRKWSAQHV